MKLSLSWNTVICSSPVLFSPLGFLFSSCPFAPSGEIGIVERSTGDEGFASPFMGAEATAAVMITNVVERKERRSESWCD